MNQAKVPTARRGVTLLELLIVLTVMGIAAALVTPMLTPARPLATSATETIFTRARQLAITRAEELRVQIRGNGAWVVRSARSRAAIDSGSVEGPIAPQDFAVDALGSCIPTGVAVTALAMDPLSCGIFPVTVTP